MNLKAFLMVCTLLGIILWLSVDRSLPQSSVPSSQLQLLGSEWHEEEDGWTGRWTRRGDSNIFDAV